MTLADFGKGVRAFSLTCSKIQIGASFAAFLVTAIYLILLLSLGRAEALALVGCCFAWLVLGGAASEIGRRLRSEPIKQFLLQRVSAEPGAAGSLEASIARASLVSLPGWMQKSFLLQGVASIAFVPTMLWALGFASWLSLPRIGSFAIIALATSLLGGLVTFYWARQGLSPWRAEVARLAGSADLEIGAAPEPSMTGRLLATVLIPSIASMALVFDVMGGSANDSSAESAREWATAVVEAVAAAPHELPLTDRIATHLPAEKFWPMPIEIIEIIEIDSGKIDANASTGVLSPRLQSELDRTLRAGQDTGTFGLVSGPEIAAFRKLENAGMLVAYVLRSDLDSGWAGFDLRLGFVLLSMLLVGLATSRLVAGDLERELELFRSAAARLAAGDLRPGVDGESADLAGGAGRELERVRISMREMVSRLSRTIGGVEGIAREMTLVAGQVLKSSSDQDQEMQKVRQVLGGIEQGFGQVRETAADLTTRIDESSSAVIELGAAGNELNETAVALSTRVDAVSGSLEQMVRSVQQVSGTTDRLAAASEETSSSMEEMASSMRAVDTSAETTANLSRDVVRIAEIGQAKVVQTIAGMEAIREATDAAENVIRGLGARTKEIGGILDVIDDVADETNLLALNAAIIAAQAGEDGRAFSVVADEIKELADRVLASTKEIGGLIRAVQDESENAIGAIEAGSVSVMSGVDLSAEAGRTLEEITVASRESGTRIGEIVASVREQTKAASHVASLMERVRESSEEISLAGSEQGRGNEIVLESVLGMREVAQQVRRTTEDQAQGFGRIRGNVEEMRDAVGRITGSLGQQSGACGQMSEVLTRVSKEMHVNEEAAEKMQAATRELIAHSDSLREESERFRV